MTPDTNYSDGNFVPTPEQTVQSVEAERAKLQARIESLEADLKLIQAGKEAAERCLRAERERALELAQNSNFSLKRDWLAIVNELNIIKGKEIGDNALDNQEYQEALVIDFENRLRIGALAEIESKDDDTVYVMARAYEIWYRACTAVLANRSLRIKINKRDEFEETKRTAREKEKEIKRAKESDKLDKRRRSPEEKMLESLTLLLGSEEAAKAHMAAMQSKARDVLNNKN